MFRILQAEWLAPKVRRIEVEAPRVAVRHRPGHFVIVRVYEGESEFRSPSQPAVPCAEPLLWWYR